MSIDIYTGYVYIWYDTKAKFFYVGGHKGKINDRYICSNKSMNRAYKLRPQTFKFKILEFTYGDVTDVRLCEQKWLNLIKDQELMSTHNIRNKTTKYYNVKKHSTGGNGSANKGNSNIGGHNKGKPMSEEQKIKISNANKGRKQTEQHKNNKKLSFLTKKINGGII
jgi:hypothetical protein